MVLLVSSFFLESFSSDFDFFQLLFFKDLSDDLVDVKIKIKEVMDDLWKNFLFLLMLLILLVCLFLYVVIEEVREQLVCYGFVDEGFFFDEECLLYF